MASERELERFRVDCILCDYKTGVMTHERALGLLTDTAQREIHRCAFKEEHQGQSLSAKEQPRG